MKKIKRNSKSYVINNVNKHIRDLEFYTINNEYFLCKGDCETCFATHCPCFEEILKDEIRNYIDLVDIIKDLRYAE